MSFWNDVLFLVQNQLFLTFLMAKYFAVAVNECLEDVKILQPDLKLS